MRSPSPWRVLSAGTLAMASALLWGAGPVAAVTGAAAAPVAQAPADFLDRLLLLLADPNVAYLLLVIGLLGIVAEVATAGTVFPGTIGAICLILDEILRVRRGAR